MQIENKKRCRETRVGYAISRDIECSGLKSKCEKRTGAKVRRTVEAVLILLGFLCILLSALLSDAESIGRYELFFGIILGVSLLLIGVYQQKIELLFRQMLKHLLCYANILNRHISAEFRAQRAYSSTAEPMGDRAGMPQSNREKKQLSRPIEIKISYENIIPIDTGRVAS